MIMHIGTGVYMYHYLLECQLNTPTYAYAAVLIFFNQEMVCFIGKLSLFHKIMTIFIWYVSMQKWHFSLRKLHFSIESVQV